MGIPYLWKSFENYGKITKLDGNNPIDSYIDGPSLAYKIFYQHTDLSVPLCTYAEYEDLLEDYVNEMILKGINIKCVIFDGSLPLDKRPVRLLRLENFLKQLKRIPVDSPAPAFAPFIFKEILSKKFPQIPIIMVPGEADPYLVSVVKNSCTPCYLLTGDSDFLIYDIGINNFIININSFHLCDCEIFVFSRKKLFENFGNDLLKIGFLMSIRKAKRPLKMCYIMEIKNSIFRGPKAESFKKFSSLYDIPNDIPKTLDELKNDSKIIWFNKIFPDLHISRISEIVWRAKDIIKMQSNEVNDKRNSIIIEAFMPLVIEDIDQPNCWITGRKWRAAAYFILLNRAGIIDDKNSQGILIAEYTRLDGSIAKNYIHPSLKGMPDFKKKISQIIIDEINENLNTNGEDNLQPFVAQIIYDYFNLSKKKLSHNDQDKPNWIKTNDFLHDFHLFSQLQCAIYSLIVLSQVSEKPLLAPSMNLGSLVSGAKFMCLFDEYKDLINGLSKLKLDDTG